MPIPAESNPTEDKKSMLIHIPINLKARLRGARQKTGTTMERLIEQAIERYLDQEGHVAEVESRPAWEKKVFDLLLAKVETRHGTRNAPDDKIVPLTMKEIADLLGTSVPVVAQALALLEARGHILREERRGWGSRRTIVLLKESAAAEGSSESRP